MKISELAEKIVKLHPDCCMAYNNIVENGNREEWYESFLLDEIISFYQYEWMDLCGCGNPEYTLEVIRLILNIQNDFHEGKIESPYEECRKVFNINNDNYVIQDGLVQFVMYQLDSYGFLEHGGSIGGAWLTEDGKDLLMVLNTWYEEYKEQDES